ncbi:MAG: spermidine/putrescine ABC transporter substrate-binding protein [Candidatus Methylomirabilales bacterium]
MRHRSISRMLTIGALLVMTGCGSGPSESGLDREVYFFNWGDYIDPAVLTAFAQEYGVRVVQDNYASNEDLLAKLQAGGAGYDVIVPSDYMVEVMIKEGLLRKLDKSGLPNLRHIGAQYLGLYYDPENRYCVPYLWGTTGVAYDADRVPQPDSWWVLWETPYRGQISMLNDQRESIAVALRLLGFSINSTDREELEAARVLLQKQKPRVRTYNSENYDQLLVQGEVVLAHAWNGDVAKAAEEKPSLKFVIPKEGGTIFYDNLCIPRSSRRPRTAEAFMNYLLRPDVAARIVRYTMQASPNDEARAHLPRAILDNPAVYPPTEAMARLDTIRDVGQALVLYDRVWTEVKAHR